MSDTLEKTQTTVPCNLRLPPSRAVRVPPNIFLKRLRPPIWLSGLMLLWGVMMTVQGLVDNYGGVVSMQFFLGTFEAGLFPGVTYYLSCWYKRSEFGIRAAVFFSAATVSGAFGGLLAAAIAQMEGVGGEHRLRPGFLSLRGRAKFLTEAERTVVVRRLQDDDQISAAGEKLRWKYIKMGFLDWKTWVA
ncbi:mfs transporter, partial [Moniliophthora roreri MCA 2997]